MTDSECQVPGRRTQDGMERKPTLQDRFCGCLLGLAVGDALGARFEGQPAEHIVSRFPTPRALIDNPPNNELWYTDDTQMAIGVAETLAEHHAILEDKLCAAFVANYVPSRGYGRGARKVLEAMEDGNDHRRVAASVFPGGSRGNGAAMRVAPVGLFFRDDYDQVWEQARASALPTHVHLLGIEGAQVLALAVAIVSKSETLDRSGLFEKLISRCTSKEFQERLVSAAQTASFKDVAALGNGIEAVDSVPTAIACFALAPDSYETAVANAIFFGGDTDTIAAMTGALCGAFAGSEAIPGNLLAVLEEQGKGRTYMMELADRLHQACEMTSAVRREP
jgi:poly(ADP-ribose) glycohydrolase ARH3